MGLRAHRRLSLAGRLVALGLSLTVVAGASMVLLVMPVLWLPGQVRAAEVRLEEALAARELAAVIAEQSSNYVEYAYVDELTRRWLRTEIASTGRRGDALVDAAPPSLRQQWRQLHDRGEVVASAADAEVPDATRTSLARLLPAAGDVQAAADRWADDAAVRARQAVDQLRGNAAVRPLASALLTDALDRIATEAGHALAVAEVEHALLEYLASFPPQLAGVAGVAERAPSQVRSLLAGLADAHDGTDESGLVQGVLEAHNRLLVDAGAVSAAALAGDGELATALFQDRLQPRLAASLTPQLEALVEDQQDRMLLATDDAVRQSRNLQAGLLAGIGLFLLLVLGAGLRLVRGVATPVRELERAHAALEHRAAHDGLTGLPNRSSVIAHLRRLAEQQRACALLFSDLDGFKDVNDSLGHASGDVLLGEVARRLTTVASGDSALVGRLSGDEFVVVLADATAQDAEAVAHGVVAVLERPFHLADTWHTLSTSVGLAHVAGGQTWDPSALLREADLAMYRAKREGRGRVEVFVPELEEALLQRLRLDRALNSAGVEGIDGSLTVHYQPIVDAADGRPVAVEALLRWGSERADVVVARAEATGAIHEVGRRVLREAARQVAEWRGTVAPGLRLSVNVSPVELSRPGYAAEVAQVLDDVGLPATAVTVEVTESTVSGADARIVRNLEALRAAGARLSVDDFGTGWSSLARLRLVAPDEVKLDRSFVAPLAPDGDSALVRAVLALAAELGCGVVAEGVEREEQRAVLAGLECGRLQGFLFARPAAAGVVGPWLAQSGALPRLPAQRGAHDVRGARNVESGTSCPPPGREPVVRRQT